jgi:hypothetical protein
VRNARLEVVLQARQPYRQGRAVGDRNASRAGLLVAVTSAGLAQELPRPPELPPPPEPLRTRFCIGSGTCSSNEKLYWGSDADQIAQEICTIHRAGDREPRTRISATVRGTRDGGKCGYNWYTVVCLR